MSEPILTAILESMKEMNGVLKFLIQEITGVLHLYMVEDLELQIPYMTEDGLLGQNRADSIMMTQVLTVILRSGFLWKIFMLI